MKSTKLVLTATVIALSGFIFGPELKADIIILQSGDIVPGKIIGSNRDGLDIVQSGSTNQEHWSVKMINKVWLERDEKWTPKFGPVAKLDFSGSAEYEKTAEL
jgi:hypothetical protein